MVESQSQFMELYKARIRELEAAAGFSPYILIEDITLDFVSDKNEYNEPDLQAVKYTKIEDKGTSFLLQIHESFSKVADALVEREAIRSFIHPTINRHPIVSYFIHAGIGSPEYLWSKMLEQLRERFVEYLRSNTELKIGIIRKDTSITFDKAQMLRILHDLNITTSKSLTQLFFWRTMFLSTGIESLEFPEAVVFKQLLTYLTPKQFGYGLKQIKDEMFEAQSGIKIPKKLFEDAFGSLVEKLDLRRTLSLNWAIANMCRYLVLIELSSSFIDSRAEFFDYFIKPIRLLATCCISHHMLLLIYADFRDAESSYLKYLKLLKSNHVIVNFEAYVVDSYENSINLNYFSHPNLSFTILTEDVMQSGAFQSEYGQYIQYLTSDHRNAKKKEEIRTVIEFLRYSQLQSDRFYPDISFRKFLEQLSVADVCILFLCIMNHTIRPFGMYPVDKQSIELLQAGINDTVRVYKRLEARKHELNRYSEAFPSLRAALIEVLNTNFGQLKQDIVEYVEKEHTRAGASTFSLAKLSEWLEHRRPSYAVFMHEHPDLIEFLFNKLVELQSQKRSEVGQPKDLSIAKRFERMFDHEFGDLVKWLGLLSRTGITVLSSDSTESVVRRIPVLQKVSEDLKGYLTLEKPQFEQKLSELVQYAGEMRAVDMNLFRSTLFAKDVFYLVVNVADSDSRIQNMTRQFFYSIKFQMGAISGTAQNKSDYTYLRIQIQPSIITELRRRVYASFSKNELRFLADPSGLHLFYSLTSTDLLMRLSNPSGELDSLAEFATRSRSWVECAYPSRKTDLSKAQKEKLADLQNSIEEQHQVLLNKRGFKELLISAYPNHDPEPFIPKEILKFIKHSQTNVKAKEPIVFSDSTVKRFKSVLNDITLSIIPSRWSLQKVILVIRSGVIDLYPDRICQSSLGLLFGPGLHSLRYGRSGAENWLLLQYYIPSHFEASSQGFKKVLDTLGEYPDLCYDLLRADAEAVYYNFDLYLRGNWINLDFVLESRFRLTDRDCEYLRSHLAEVALPTSDPSPANPEALDLLVKFQNSEIERKIEMLPEILSLSSSGTAMLDVELVPESFDLHHSFAILAFSSDSAVLERVKIMCMSVPKSVHWTVTRVQSSSAGTKANTGVLIAVNCGAHSVRYSILGLYSHLKRMGCESVEIFTGLADPIISERSILFFKQKSWTAWISADRKLIPFFPLIGRYSYPFDSEDLMNLYAMAEKMQIFAVPEYEQRMKRLRHAFTEVKKSGEKVSLKAVQAMMERIVGQNDEVEKDESEH
jgi:hypothetical protein